MSVNQGVAPPDFETDVGKVRALLGDTNWESLDPEIPGEGTYDKYSDAELQVYLNQSGSVEGAVATAYLQMASSAAEEAKAVKDYDLQVDLTKRAEALRKIAEMWESKASETSLDYFNVVDTVVTKDPHRTPELAQREFRWI